MQLNRVILNNYQSKISIVPFSIPVFFVFFIRIFYFSPWKYNIVLRKVHNHPIFYIWFFTDNHSNDKGTFSYFRTRISNGKDSGTVISFSYKTENINVFHLWSNNLHTDKRIGRILIVFFFMWEVSSFDNNFLPSFFNPLIIFIEKVF